MVCILTCQEARQDIGVTGRESVPSPGKFSGRTSGKLSVRIMYLRSRLRFFRCEGVLLLYVLSVRWAFKGSTFPRKLTRLCCELGAGIRLGPRTR